MNQQQSLLKISELLSRFKFQVSILNASSMFDINVVSESFLIPILNIVFDCNLENANNERKNFPAVDLVDKKRKICFQITSSSNATKVRETLEKIVKNELYNTFNSFYIFIISEKCERYNQEMIDFAKKDRFQFTNENIFDIEGLFNLIKSKTIDEIAIIEKYLKKQYTDVITTNQILETKVPDLISKLNNDYNLKMAASKLETANKARLEWYNKKAFLEINVASIVDLNQKYAAQKSIDECTEKIEHYEKEITSVINIITKEDEE